MEKVGWSVEKLRRRCDALVANALVIVLHEWLMEQKEKEDNYNEENATHDASSYGSDVGVSTAQ